MPKLPIYESQLGAPRGTALDVSSSQTYMPFTAATMHTGNMIEQRGETMLREYDTSRAYTAFNQLRDVSRGKMAELMAREGLSAQGAQTEYTEFYRKAQEDVAKETINAFSQGSLFDKLSHSHQQGDLDRLASHEFTEHKKYKVSVVNGYVATTARDVADNAADYAKVDGMIYGQTEPDGTVTPGLWGAIDALGEGIDRTTAKMQATEAARFSQVDALISSDPKKAAEAVEKYKSELGDKYAPLKKRLESQTHDNMLGEAYGALNAQFGNNHEAKIAYVNNKANWPKLGSGFDYKEAKELDARFSGMLADRDRVERSSRERLEQAQKDNAGAVLQALYNPNAPRVDVHELHRQRKIDNATYEHAIKARESTVVDNPETVSSLHDSIERGIDIKDDIRAAVDAGTLSERTAASVLKHSTDEKSKRAMQYIDRALKPSEADKWSPDKHLKYADATRLYYAKIAAGMDYEQAAAEVVSGYISNLRRTWRNLPAPPGMTDDQKRDPVALQTKQAELTQKLQTKQITPDEFRLQMKNIDNLMNLAAEDLAAESSNAEIEALRKKKVQK